MPARNIYHDGVIRALTADGWTITHDPLTVSYGGKDVFVDLGAEKLAIGAEKGGRKIAIEVQSFLGDSPVNELHGAVGQYEVYRTLLEETEPDRVLFLAVPGRVHEEFLTERFGRLIVDRLRLRLLIFDDEREVILQWIEPKNTEPSPGDSSKPTRDTGRRTGRSRRKS
ncbi:MAG TPA: element excision factor XisH family protein [Isosphaeraceae bacterium]|jgi:hypothetical protein|nr:element excision factor XisH family protein [Isosphaeraceae bacterium]